MKEKSFLSLITEFLKEDCEFKKYFIRILLLTLVVNIDPLHVSASYLGDEPELVIAEEDKVGEVIVVPKTVNSGQLEIEVNQLTMVAEPISENPVTEILAEPQDDGLASETLVTEPEIVSENDATSSEYEGYISAGEFHITYYCCEKYKHLCGTGDGVTASGTVATPGRTIAVDPKVIPLGSKVIIDFGEGNVKEYVAEDTGALIKGNRIDIVKATHEEALNYRSRDVEVYYLPGD